MFQNKYGYEFKRQAHPNRSSRWGSLTHRIDQKLAREVSVNRSIQSVFSMFDSETRVMIQDSDEIQTLMDKLNLRADQVLRPHIARSSDYGTRNSRTATLSNYT